jgi:hypothetical protein
MKKQGAKNFFVEKESLFNFAANKKNCKCWQHSQFDIF